MHFIPSGGCGHGVVKSLCQVAMLAIFLDLIEANEKLTCMTLLCMIALGNKKVAHTFLLSSDNANGRLCQERLSRSINFATMVT